ncbi:MAG TPA: hypothetical protein PLV92_25985, partial [Pirellulaceae bacterium]|nr:hypothetical protein [Pirellulaceae bacterium]
RVGAVPDTVIHDVTGLLVEPGDARGLADSWLAIWNDSALANRLATAARQHVVQHASVQQMVGGYEQLLERLLS